MASIRQPSFAGGEIAPELRGRTDLEKRSVALRRLRDFFVSKSGAAVSRPGTEYCGTTKSNGVARLVPFVYSDTQTYVLEFTDLKVRFWSDGALVGAPYEVTTPYVAADLDRLAWAQSGDILTLVHPSYAPRELARLTHTSWTLTTLDFDVPTTIADLGFAPVLLQHPLRWIEEGDTNHTARKWTYQVTASFLDSRGVETESAPFTIVDAALYYGQDWRDNFTYGNGTKVIGTASSGGGTLGIQYRSIQPNNRNHLLTDAAWWVADATTTSPTPRQLDSVPAVVVFDSDAPLRPIDVEVFPNTGGLWANDPNMLTFRVYRGREGLFGLVGTERGTTAGCLFLDVGQEPDYTIQPPQGRNPFKVYDSSGALTRTDYPSTVCFYEGRRCFGGMSGKPGWIYCSATGDWTNFDTHLLAVASDEVEMELASRRREDVRHLVGLDQLIALTNSSPWSIRGPGGDALTAQGGINEARAQGDVGSAWVPPLVVGGNVLFVRAKGSGVVDLTFSNERRGYVPADLSLLSAHFFRGYTIVDWAYAEDPWSVIWAVRDDGALLSLSYLREQDVWAWALHTISGGTVEHVCSVPEGDEDAVYLVVKRTISGSTVRYVERLSSRVDLTAFYPYDAAVTSSLGTLRLLWHLDEASGTATGADAQGVYPLSTVNGTPTVVAGHSGNARNFGANSYLAGPADAATVTKVRGGGWTLRFWIYAPALAAAQKGVLTLTDGTLAAGSYAFSIFTISTGINFSGPGGNKVVALTAGAWHHVAITCTLSGANVNIAFYVDTVATGSTGNVVNTFPSTMTAPIWYVGAALTGLSGVKDFDGSLDEIAFYDQVLTAAQITADFNTGHPFTSVTGLSHLQGQQVYALGDDGAEQGPFTVAGGAITLTTGVMSAQVGAKFQPEMETLDLASGTAEIRTKPKIVTAVAFEAEVPDGYADAISVGPDTSHLTPASESVVLDTDDEEQAHLIATVNVSATWGVGGRAALRVTGPRPVTVYGVTREVQSGGD